MVNGTFMNETNQSGIKGCPASVAAVPRGNVRARIKRMAILGDAKVKSRIPAAPADFVPAAPAISC